MLVWSEYKCSYELVKLIWNCIHREYIDLEGRDSKLYKEETAKYIPVVYTWMSKIHMTHHGSPRPHTNHHHNLILNNSLALLKS